VSDFKLWVHNANPACEIEAARVIAKYGAYVDSFAKLPRALDFKAWKNQLIKDGVPAADIPNIVYQGSLKRGSNLWGTWGRYYEEISGTKRPVSADPTKPYHAHHIVEKTPTNPANAANYKILEDLGVDPF
jgi:hypothetical protein